MLRPIMIAGALITASMFMLPSGSAQEIKPAETKSVQQTASHSARNVLRMAIHDGPLTVDPALAEDSRTGTFLRTMFDGLTRTGLDGNIQGSMAEKIEISEDLMTYTFHLRPAKWSNGDTVTAHDFEFAWKRAIDPATGSRYAYQMFLIKNAEKANLGKASLADVGVRALSDKVLQVKLEQPTPYFLELTSFYTYYPVNKKVVEANPGWNKNPQKLVVNGPFQLFQWVEGESIQLVKNSSYWDKDAVSIEGIHFTFSQNGDEEYARFRNGQIDWIGAPFNDFTIEAVLDLRLQGKLLASPIAGTYWYKFNVERPPFNNVKIRKAFAYAVDRQELVDDVMLGNIPAMGVVPPSMALSKEGYFADHDTVQAKKWLAEGIKELGITKLPPIRLSYNALSGHALIAEKIQQQWKQTLGVDVVLEEKEWSTHLEDLHNGDYQVARMGWLADFNDPINFLELFKDKNGGNNDTGWENQTFRDLLNQSAVERDPLKRKEILRQAEQVLMDEMPVMPVYFYYNTWAKSDAVSHVLMDGLGFVDFKWTTIKE